MPSVTGPAAYNAKLLELEEEMAKEKGVFRSSYTTLVAFRKDLNAAGITFPMVREEYTRRSGKPSAIQARAAAWALLAAQEEERGLPMRTRLTAKDGGTYQDRFIHKERLALRAAAAAATAAPAAVAAKPQSPEPVAMLQKAAEQLAARRAAAAAKAAAAKAAAAKAVAAPAAKAEPMLQKAAEQLAARRAAAQAAKAAAAVAAKAAVAVAAPVVAAAAAAPAPKPQSAKEAAEQAIWDAMYEEITLGGTVYLRWKKIGTIFVKGEGVRELGDEMPEWDEDLGEFKAE